MDQFFHSFSSAHFHRFPEDMQELLNFNSIRPFGYGSIPINTMFRGLFTSIKSQHIPAILMFTGGHRGFWPIPIESWLSSGPRWRAKPGPMEPHLRQRKRPVMAWNMAGMGVKPCHDHLRFGKVLDHLLKSLIFLTKKNVFLHQVPTLLEHPLCLSQRN